MTGTVLVQEGGLYWAKLEGVQCAFEGAAQARQSFWIVTVRAPAPFNYEVQVPETAFVEACAPSDAGS